METTPQEKTVLEVLAADEATFATLQKVFQNYIERQKDIFLRTLSVKKEISNENIGAQIRAFDEASYLIAGIWREVGQFRPQKDREVKNHAR